SIVKNLRDEALHMHRVNQGKLTTKAKVEVKNEKDLSLAYSPGVAEPCKEIHDRKETVYDYTMKGNMVGVVSNGSAVLRLWNIVSAWSLSVIERIAVLFKCVAGVDSFPICLKSDDIDEIVQTVKLM